MTSYILKAMKEEMNSRTQESNIFLTRQEQRIFKFHDHS